MVLQSSFVLDDNEHFFCLDTGRIITGKDLEYLLSILNSKLFFFSVGKFYGGGGLGAAGVRMKHTFFEKFQCPTLPNLFSESLVEIVNQISEKRKKGENTSKNECEIDKIVYQLYSLNEDEIEAIENGINFINQL